jgi:DNA repair and recombination protein RAD54B
MARDYIKDDILRQLIYSPPERTEKLFGSRLESILDGVDLDNLPAPEDDASILTPRNVPGGSISFLFERSSTVLLDPGDSGEVS